MLISVVLIALYALAAVAFLLGGSIGLMISLLLGAAVIPGFRSLLIQFTIFPLVKRLVIDPYYAEHPHEDMDKRQDLALEPTEQERTENPEEESIFRDMGRTEHEQPMESKTARRIPKQYSEEQLRRGKRFTRNESDADDDDTI